jgi:hypothetical protein
MTCKPPCRCPCKDDEIKALREMVAQLQYALKQKGHPESA